MEGEEAQSSTAITEFRQRRGCIKRSNKCALRQRAKSPSSPSSSSGSDTATGVVVKKPAKKLAHKNPLIQTSRKREKHTEHDDSDLSSDHSEGVNAVDDTLHVAFSASSGTERAGPSDMGATAVSEIDTDANVDAQAQFERVQQILKEKHDDKIYRGAAMYGAKEKRDTVWGNASSGLNRFGPARAPNFIRQSVRWDFAPDICKDYKETGFCTFGDSCKFLHDRTDYKHGWEIERDYESGRMKEDDPNKYVVSSEEEEDECDLPFKCFICRESFVNPVVTKCKHYFCEKCALNRFQQTSKCYVCEENTMGVFKVAKDLIAKIKERDTKGPTKDEDDSDAKDQDQDEDGNNDSTNN